MLCDVLSFSQHPDELARGVTEDFPFAMNYSYGLCIALRKANHLACDEVKLL